VLEEPPGETVFFLIAEIAEALLPTIRSRCQHFPFQPLSLQELAPKLVEMGYAEAEAAELARFSHGSLGRALGVNVEQYTELRDRVVRVVEAALGGKSYFALMDAVKGITVDRVEMPERLLILEEIVRDLIVLQNSPGSPIVHRDLRDRLEPLAEGIGPSALHAFYQQLLEYREAILKINANIGLSLHALFLPLRAEAARAR
jgi:DNA polymerase-3 subunit delta'